MTIIRVLYPPWVQLPVLKILRQGKGFDFYHS